MYYNSVVSRKPEKCDKCQKLEREIERLKEEIETYRDSVKRRRNADDVWIEDDTVMYR